MNQCVKNNTEVPVIGPPTPSPEAVPYAGSISDAQYFISLPNLRQFGDYSCGATCVQMIMNWLVPFFADYNLSDYLEYLGTTPETGTSPDSILAFFDRQSVAYESRDGWSLDGLAESLRAGRPMIMAIQAWAVGPENCGGTGEKSPDELDDGHWVICVGYRKVENKYTFYFNDPACVGHCLLEGEELEDRWIDKDADCKEHRHYGIAVEPSKAYDPCGVFQLYMRIPHV